MELSPLSSYEYLKFIPPNDLDASLKEVVDEIVDDIILGECFDIHRYYKLKIFHLNMDEKDMVQYYIDNKSGYDISGHQQTKEKLKNVMTNCKLCEKSVTAVLFVKHLQDHYKQSRASCRIANQRIKSSANDELDLADHEDDDDDTSDSYSQRPAKKRQDKNSSGSSRNRGKSKASKQ